MSPIKQSFQILYINHIKSQLQEIKTNSTAEKSDYKRDGKWGWFKVRKTAARWHHRWFCARGTTWSLLPVSSGSVWRPMGHHCTKGLLTPFITHPFPIYILLV